MRIGPQRGFEVDEVVDQISRMNFLGVRGVSERNIATM